VGAPHPAFEAAGRTFDSCQARQSMPRCSALFWSIDLPFAPIASSRSTGAAKPAVAARAGCSGGWGCGGLAGGGHHAEPIDLRVQVAGNEVCVGLPSGSPRVSPSRNVIFGSLCRRIRATAYRSTPAARRRVAVVCLVSC